MGRENENCLLVSERIPIRCQELPSGSKHVLPAAIDLGTDINLLLLDDEADHASLNLELTKKSPIVMHHESTKKLDPIESG